MRANTVEITVESIRGALARAMPLALEDGDLVRAGVLVLLYPKDGELCVLLNKRTNLVEYHKGEISFPGGAQDPEDDTILDTALRETCEEMGIRREDVEILGRLDQVATRSGFAITPFVGTIPGSYFFHASRVEVAEVLEVPLEVLQNRANRRERVLVGERGVAGEYAYTFGEHLIYGATARILTQFLGLIAPGLR